MAQPQTIARPYAKAIFELAGTDSEQQQWQQFLAAANRFAASPEVMKYIHTPGFGDRIGQWLDEWLQQSRKQGLSAQERNFLQLLEDHERFAVLPAIDEAFTELCSASYDTCIVHVKSAKALDKKAQKSLARLLETKLGKAVQLEVKEEPELMAGVVIEYDGQVINQSLQGRLQQFARKLDD